MYLNNHDQNANIQHNIWRRSSAPDLNLGVFKQGSVFSKKVGSGSSLNIHICLKSCSSFNSCFDHNWKLIFYIEYWILYVSVSVYLSLYIYTYIYIYMYIVYMFISLCISLSLTLSLSLYVYISVYLSPCISLDLCISILYISISLYLGLVYWKNSRFSRLGWGSNLLDTLKQITFYLPFSMCLFLFISLSM